MNLSGLIGCELRVYGAPSTLHMSKIDNCTWVNCFALVIVCVGVFVCVCTCI